MSGLRRLSRDPGRLLGPAVVLCVPLLFVGRALFTGAVMAPLDLQLLMEPWKSECLADYPGFREAQTPLMDCLTQYHPWRVYTRACLRGGEFPLWDAYAFCGTPLLANQQSAVFYPPNLLFWLLPLGLAYTWGAYLALVLAGAFTWGLARELGISRAGAALAAVGFVSSGYMVVWLCYMGPVNSFLWAPLGVWMVFRHGRLRDLGSLLALAVAAACTVLGGHAQAALYALALMLAAGAYQVLAPRSQTGPGRLARGLPLLAAIAAGGALAAVQALPTLELSLLNYRTLGDTLPPRGLQIRQLNALVAPQAHGNVAWFSDPLCGVFGFHSYVETTGYVVLVALWLGAFGAAFGTDRRRWLFVGALVLGLGLALEGPHQRLLGALVPPLEQMSNVGRAVCVYGLTLPVLAGWGLDRLRAYPWAEEKPRSHALALALGLAVVCALALSVSWSRLLLVEGEARGNATVTGLLGPVRTSLCIAGALALAPAVLLALARRGLGGRALAGIALGLALADAAVFAWGFHPAVAAGLVDARPATLSWLRERAGDDYRVLSLPLENSAQLSPLLPNLATLAPVRDAAGYDSLYPRTAADVLRSLRPEKPAGLLEGARGELADRLGIRYVVSAVPPAAGGGRALAPTERRLVFENKAAWPIAFATEGPAPPADAAAARPVPVRWGPNSRHFEASPGVTAWLCETAYGGWHAYSGGREAPLTHVPPAHKCAAVAESGRLDMVYEPGSFAVGAFVTLAMAGVAAGLAAGRRTMREEGRRAKD